MPAILYYPVFTMKTLREIVARNIAAIMDNPTTPLTQEAVGKRAGLPQRTVGRLKNGTTAASLTTLAAISRGLGVEPWQLLVPDLDPRNPPIIRPTSQSEQRLYKKFAQLIEESKKISH